MLSWCVLAKMMISTLPRYAVDLLHVVHKLSDNTTLSERTRPGSWVVCCRCTNPECSFALLSIRVAVLLHGPLPTSMMYAMLANRRRTVSRSRTVCVKCCSSPATSGRRQVPAGRSIEPSHLPLPNWIPLGPLSAIVNATWLEAAQ